MLYIYGMTLICINILALIFDSLHSTLYMPSTLIALRRWLQFAAETCEDINTYSPASI
jgi:hypothetical protein